MIEHIKRQMADLVGSVLLAKPGLPAALSDERRKAAMAAYIKEHTEKFSADLLAAWDAEEKDREHRLSLLRVRIAEHQKLW